MKPLLIFMAALAIGVSRATASTPLPSDFTLDEDVTLFQPTMSLSSPQGKDLGKITKDILTATTQFTYTQANGAEAGHAEESLFSWGHESKIYSGHGRLIGTVKEKVYSSFFRQYNQYEVLDADGNLIGISEKDYSYATDITVTAPDGTVIATIRRAPFTVVADSWQVHVDTSRVDPRLLIFVAAFKTDGDNEKSSD